MRRFAITQHVLLGGSIVLVALLLIVFVTRILDHTSHPQVRNPYAVGTRRGHQAVVSFTHASSQNLRTVTDAPVITTGCNQAVKLKSGVTTDIAMTSNHQQRSYLLYLPTSYSNSTPHAVVMDFHGYDQNDLIQEAVSKFNPVANANSIIMVYPNGLFGVTGKRGWDTGLHPGIKANDTLFISDLLDQLQSNLCVQQNQIYATGLSNGGGFVNLLACELSDRIAAFAPVSGSYVTPARDCRPSRPVPIIEFHGTADKVNPYNGDPVKREPSIPSWIHGWLGRDTCSMTPVVSSANTNTTLYSWSNCADQAAIEQYKITGETHRWPNELFAQTLNGKNQAVSAAQVIWQFFAQHPLTTGVAPSGTRSL